MTPSLVLLVALLQDHTPPPSNPPGCYLTPCYPPPATGYPPGCCPVTPVAFPMTVKPKESRWFMSSDLHINGLDSLRENSLCRGYISPAGPTIRYFVDGTSPSATVGTLFPPAVVPGQPQPPTSGPSGTIEGTQLVLYTKTLVRGFKATAATGAAAVIQWYCDL